MPIRQYTNGAKKIGGDTAHVGNAPVTIDQINAIILPKTAQSGGALNFASHTHLQQPEYGAPKIGVTAALAFMRKHICLEHQRGNHTVIRIADGIDILDHRRAIAQYLALATSTATTGESTQNQWLIFSRISATHLFLAVERRHGMGHGMRHDDCFPAGAQTAEQDIGAANIGRNGQALLDPVQKIPVSFS